MDSQLIGDLLTLRYLMQRNSVRIVTAEDTKRLPRFRDRSSDETIQERFTEFHEANPHVFHLFAWFAFELKLNGKKGSAKLIFERMRWEINMATLGDEFKLNNNFSSRYTRLIIERFPSLEDCFETRVLQSS